MKHLSFFVCACVCGVLCVCESECAYLSVNQPPSHTPTYNFTHPMQATLPPKAALLSLFFHHTALEVSPVISGTSCSQTALALSLRDRGNRATPKHPAAPPMTSGSFAPLPKKKLLSEFSSVKKRGKKPKSCQKCFCKASANGGRNASCYLLTARSRTFCSVLKSLKPKSILPNYQIWDVLPVYILNGKLKKRKE